MARIAYNWKQEQPEQELRSQGIASIIPMGVREASHAASIIPMGARDRSRAIHFRTL